MVESNKNNSDHIILLLKLLLSLCSATYLTYKFNSGANCMLVKRSAHVLCSAHVECSAHTVWKQ